MEDFPAGVNKEVLFQFHTMLLAVQAYASCSHFNSVPLHNLIPSLLLPSHDCQFPRGLQRWKVEVWTLCQLMHFCLARGFISVFVFLSSAPLVFFEFWPHFFVLLCLQQHLLPDLHATQKYFSSHKRHLAFLGNNDLQFCNCIFFLF